MEHFDTPRDRDQARAKGAEFARWLVDAVTSDDWPDAMNALALRMHAPEALLMATERLIVEAPIPVLDITHEALDWLNDPESHGDYLVGIAHEFYVYHFAPEGDQK